MSDCNKFRFFGTEDFDYSRCKECKHYVFDAGSYYCNRMMKDSYITNRSIPTGNRKEDWH